MQMQCISLLHALYLLSSSAPRRRSSSEVGIGMVEVGSVDLCGALDVFCEICKMRDYH